MSFEYNWKNNEANFGPPTDKQVPGGAHISFEIILKKDDKYVALRRPEAIPEHETPPNNTSEGLLYFCHNLIRYGESINDSINRIVKSQTGVQTKFFKIINVESTIQEKDSQWAFTVYVLAELEEIPTQGNYGNKITEVVTFSKNNIPDKFGWWTKKELLDFL